MNNSEAFDPTRYGLSEEDLIPESIVQSVVAAAGGEVMGRIRLQKLVFLLDQLGLDSGFSYTYHHYGPYSSELTHAADFAKAFGFVEEEFRHRNSDGARYSVFRKKTESGSRPRADFLENHEIQMAIGLINSVNSTILELAATVYWLKHVEALNDWSDEIVKRKGTKIADGRLDKAIELLDKLNLSQATRFVET